MSRQHKVAIVLVVVVLMLGAFWYGKHSTLPMSHDMAMGSGDSDVAMTPPKVLYWHDPMVPTQRFDKPGKSPFMDMQLVPVYADESGSEAGVRIAADTQQNLGMRIATVRLGSISQETRVQGNVVWNEHAIDVVTARAQGFIERLHVRAALESVKQGELLAEIYVPDWIAVQEEYLFTRDLSGEMGQQLRSGAIQRLRVAGMNEIQIADVVRTGRVQARVSIRAPRDGVVAQLNVREGDTVSMGMALFRINGISPIWLDAQVPESLIAAVSLGDEVRVTTVARPNQHYVGKVSLLAPDIDPMTRTQRVRITLANPNDELLPGMFASMTLIQRTSDDALLVPTEAIIASGERSLVFVVNADGTFSPQEVITGLEGERETVVLSGLRAEQKVVVSGQFLLDSEASLKGIMSRMSGESP